MTRSKLTPRNLTAQRDWHVRQAVGNPVTTTLDAAVANCFPGLEYDVRALDCRFFPGLVFQFVQAPYYPVDSALPDQQGAHLAYLDFLLDPMLQETSEEAWVQALLDKYREPLTTTLRTGRWYLDWIEQGGRRLSMRDSSGVHYDGYMVWRLVRSLEPDLPLNIGLAKRGLPEAAPIELSGYRRQYLNSAGVYDEAYRAGELTQSMCNPWHHDFRDCACHYWATQHPDVVLGNQAPAGGKPGDPIAATTYLDWLRRRGPSADVAASNTIGANRPYQIDHYEMNRVWESLPFVLEGKELQGDYGPTLMTPAAPYASTAELIKVLETDLGPMELALAIQYLYALFSVKSPEEARKSLEEARASRFTNLAEDVQAIRQQILLVAVGEMAHLRWVNQILWELDRNRLGPPGWHYQPVVTWTQKRELFVLQSVTLSRLTPDAIEFFIDIENPHGRLARAYLRCMATLKQAEYPRHLSELAARIDDDGIAHFERFRNIKLMMDRYAATGGKLPYLRDVTPTKCPDTDKALEIFAEIRRHFSKACLAQAANLFEEAEASVRTARSKMQELQQAAEAAAAKGLGIPFFDAPK